MSLPDAFQLMVDDTDWHDRAACRPGKDRDLHYLFIPDENSSKNRQEAASRFAEALTICASCEVRQFCQQAAEKLDVRFGVWGGRLFGKGVSADKDWQQRGVRHAS